MFFNFSLGIMSFKNNLCKFIRGQHANFIFGMFETFNLENFGCQLKRRPKTFIFSMKRCSHTIYICFISHLLKQKSIGYKMWQPMWRLHAANKYDIYSNWCHVPIYALFDKLMPFWTQTSQFFTEQNLVKCGNNPLHINS